jgi:hypothetical protein
MEPEQLVPEHLIPASPHMRESTLHGLVITSQPNRPHGIMHSDQFVHVVLGEVGACIPRYRTTQVGAGGCRCTPLMPSSSTCCLICCTSYHHISRHVCTPYHMTPAGGGSCRSGIGIAKCVLTLNTCLAKRTTLLSSSSTCCVLPCTP